MQRRDATTTVVAVLAIGLIWGMVLWQFSRPAPPQSVLEPQTPTGPRMSSKIPPEATPPPEVRPMATTIVSITAYLTDADLSDNQASAGVFDPEGNLLGLTIEKGIGEMSGGGEWITFDFASPLDVSAHEQVRLAVFGNFEEVGHVATGPDVTFDTNAVYTGPGSWPAHVDPPEEFGWFEEDKAFSIYATGGNGAKIGNEVASEVGFYMEGEKVCATGLLATAPIHGGDVAITVTEMVGAADQVPADGFGIGVTVAETVGAEDNVPGDGLGIGITVAETVGAEDGFRRQSHCWGRRIEPEQEQGGTYVEDPVQEEGAGTYVEDPQQSSNLYREI